MDVVLLHGVDGLASVESMPSYMTLRGALRRRIGSTNHESRNKLKDRQLNTGEK